MFFASGNVGGAVRVSAVLTRKTALMFGSKLNRKRRVLTRSAAVRRASSNAGRRPRGRRRRTASLARGLCEPGWRSTPLATSTASGRTAAIAWPTLAGVRPPAKNERDVAEHRALLGDQASNRRLDRCRRRRRLRRHLIGLRRAIGRVLAPRRDSVLTARGRLVRSDMRE